MINALIIGLIIGTGVVLYFHWKKVQSKKGPKDG